VSLDSRAGGGGRAARFSSRGGGVGGQAGGWSAFWTETVPRGWDIFVNFHWGLIASRKLTKRPSAVTCGLWKLVNFCGFPSKPTEVK
jgi:hypothetical protein